MQSSNKTETNMRLPIADVEISRLQTAVGNEIVVIREDLLFGGTKQRACEPYLEVLKSEGHFHFVYASPFAGFAQVALAASCEKLGLKATIFCERTAIGAEPKFHDFSLLAKECGASIVLCESLNDAEQRAIDFSRSVGAYKIPLGFACDLFHKLMLQCLAVQWSNIAVRLQSQPMQLWVSTGSGTLTKILAALVPKTIKICAVDIRVLKENDFRILSLKRNPRVKYYQSELQFKEPASVQAGIPSNLHYDPKVW